MLNNSKYFRRKIVNLLANEQIMKSTIFLLISFFLFYNSLAKSPATEHFVLVVIKKDSRNNDSVNVVLQFKPGKMLTIKTAGGKRLSSNEYTIQQNAIVIATSSDYGSGNTDTIPLEEIVRIRGKVYGNTGRKVTGQF